MSTPYSTIGGYTSGLWLVTKQATLNSNGGTFAIVDKAHLPGEGQGYAYYWLGATQQQAQSRLTDAIGHLLGAAGSDVSLAPGTTYQQEPGLIIQQAFSRGPIQFSATNGASGGLNLIDGLLYGAGGILAGVKLATSFGAGRAGAGGVAGREGASGAKSAAGGGAGAGAASTIKSAASNLSTAAKELGGAAVAATIWDWLTTPGNWVRLLEYLGGAVLIFFGIRQLAA